jgi:hypothetical protein
MRKSILLFGCVVFAYTSLIAHPGIGIRKDKNGNIYYTDLKQVWKITSDGKKTIVVPGVHTHELLMDIEGNLFGEHLWYNGEKENTWGHYLWRLNPDGHVEKIKDDTEGFLENYGFLMDSSGNMYWIERWKITRFKKKTPAGVITTIAEGNFKGTLWQYVSPSGDLYFVCDNDLYTIPSNGQPKKIALQVSTDKSAMGIWTDKDGKVYFADFSSSSVKYLDADGGVKTLVKTDFPWGPTGGVFDDKGNLWLLEGTRTNEVRAVKIDRRELADGPGVSLPVSNDQIWVVIAIVLGIVIVFVLIKSGKTILRRFTLVN